MKRILWLLVALLAVGAAFRLVDSPRPAGAPSAELPVGALEQAIRDQAHGVQVQGSGVVSRVLDDDDRGSRHQRFILRLPSGDTLLVAHNIDLAPRIPDLRRGDVVEFSGEYEWNESGGVVHWTHHDPAGQHVSGWLRRHGELYQ